MNEKFFKERLEMNGRYLIFETEAEFADFCFAPFAVLKESEDGGYYYCAEYSEDYLYCIDKDITFVIKEKNPKVYTFPIITKRLPIRLDDTIIGKCEIERGVQRTVQLEVTNLDLSDSYKIEKRIYERKKAAGVVESTD